jgi:hypothetical protein
LPGKGRLLILSGAAVLFVALGLLLTARGEAVVVHDAGGGELVRVPLPESGRFSLEYLHSYYRVPAAEHFVAESGGFRLVGISSPSEEVLDYYGLEGEREFAGGWFRLELEEPRSYESMSLIATQKGRRTLVVSGERIPLYAEKARHLTIGVKGRISNRVVISGMAEALTGMAPEPILQG